MDIVLIEKLWEWNSGLTREDTLNLLEKLGDDEFDPVEFEDDMVESSAIGFISKETASELDYDYESTGLHNYISEIHNNENHPQKGEYEFQGLKIFLQCVA